MKYRSKLDIYNVVLGILTEGSSKKTSIKFKAYLTSRQLKKYLSKMVEVGWIQYSKNRRVYRITKRGLTFLEFENKIEPSFKALEHVIENTEKS